jgi:hypothetical protein
MALKISLDGGRTWVAAPEGIRILYDRFGDNGWTYREPDQLQIHCTTEGVILDALHFGDVVGSEAATWDERIDALVEENA